MLLSRTEAEAIDTLTAKVESRTGVQVVTALVPRSDSYHELPWKAFALGASVGALAVVAADVWRPQWITAYTALIHATIILGIGGASALLAAFVPPFARLFLRDTHSHVEVRQYAESLFLRRELFRTRNRTAVLVFVSAFERRIEIRPDVGLHGRVSDAEWHRAIDAMTPRLREARPFHALQDAIAEIERLLLSKGFAARESVENELPNRPIEERGV